MASPRARVIRTSNKSVASLYLEDESIALIGNKRNFVLCNKLGTAIRGPVSFISDSMSRRSGGLFTGINDFFELIPQTIVTPIPSKIPMPPVIGVINIIKDLAFFTSLLI